MKIGEICPLCEKKLLRVNPFDKHQLNCSACGENFPVTSRLDKITTWWKDLKWNLFGETKILNWFLWGGLIFQLAVLFGVAGIVIHFLFKYW